MSRNSDDQARPLTEHAEPARTAEASAQASLVGPANQSSGFSSESSNNLQHSVELHIEELVLDGFDPTTRYAIGQAVERELARLFDEQGAPPAITHDGEVPHVDGGALEISAGSNAATIGRRLARAIYGGFDQ